MAAYLVLDLQVKDDRTYAEYVDRVPLIVERYGGRYLARGGLVLPLAGGWAPERVVIIEFESLDAVGRFVLSKDYRQIAPLREQAAVTRAIAVEGVARK